MQVGDVPIGGLNYAQAAERLFMVYRSPIEIVYDGHPIQIRPAVLGFEPQVDHMLAVADNQRVTEPFWAGFGISSGRGDKSYQGASQRFL